MRFAHTNIAANNWKILSEFYIKVFNCKIKPPIRKLSGAWLDNATGLKNAKLEVFTYHFPGVVIIVRLSKYFHTRRCMTANL